MTTDEKIRAAIKVECDRQHVGEDRQEMLVDMYYALLYSERNVPLSRDLLNMIAYGIEPDNNGHYRTTPVSFNGIVGGVLEANINRAMEQWIDWFNSGLKNRFNATDVDVVIKEFLDIHPFIDGNGRTAWLLRVWMLNQWDDPKPLPDYYGCPVKDCGVDHHELEFCRP